MVFDRVVVACARYYTTISVFAESAIGKNGDADASELDSAGNAVCVSS